MRAHVIQSGVVVNTIVVDSLDFMPDLIDADLHGGGVGWRWDGAQMLPPEPRPQSVPESLTPRQFRQALNHFGLRAQVNSAVGQADQDTKDWYEYATSFDRHHPTLVAMATQMGFTSDQMDAVWTYGAAL